MKPEDLEKAFKEIEKADCDPADLMYLFIGLLAKELVMLVSDFREKMKEGER